MAEMLLAAEFVLLNTTDTLKDLDEVLDQRATKEMEIN